MRSTRPPSTTETVTIKSKVLITAVDMNREVDMKEEATNPEAEEAVEDAEAVDVDSEEVTKTNMKTKRMMMITMVRARSKHNTEEVRLVVDTNIVEATQEEAIVLLKKSDMITTLRTSNNPSLITSKLSRMRYRTRIISALKSSGSTK